VHTTGLSRIRGPLPAARVRGLMPSSVRCPRSAVPAAFDMLIAAYSLAAAFWQIANPPERLTDVYAKEPDACRPSGNIDFASALNRLLPPRALASSAESGPPEKLGKERKRPTPGGVGQ